MNKKIFGGIAILAITVAFNVTLSNQKQDKASMLALANVEASADCEITKNGKTVLDCSGAGTCSSEYWGYTLTCDGKKK